MKREYQSSNNKLKNAIFNQLSNAFISQPIKINIYTIKLVEG